MPLTKTTAAGVATGGRDAKNVVNDDILTLAGDDMPEKAQDYNADILNAKQPDGNLHSKQGAKYSQEDIDNLERSIESQVAAMGQATAEALRKEQKYKVLIPIDKLNPNNNEVVVALNGWNLQIKKNVPVMLAEPIYDILEESGYNPTLVR